MVGWIYLATVVFGVVIRHLECDCVSFGSFLRVVIFGCGWFGDFKLQLKKLILPRAILLPVLVDQFSVNPWFLAFFQV